MKRITLFFIFYFSFLSLFSQQNFFELNKNWQFREFGSVKWYKANVPGTVHTDLMAGKLIPDPFYRDNENKVQWVSQKDWEYETTFDLSSAVETRKYIELVFDGLDTYADVYLNNHLILQANNMFRTWRIDVKNLLRSKANRLIIVFRSADRVADSLAKAALPLFRPCENNRHYVRKAQYNFGWDWAPKLTTCGIWRKVRIEAFDTREKTADKLERKDKIELIQKPDFIGQSFYFAINGKPTFMKGANWVPADVFLPRITHEKYRYLLTAAKEAGFNLLRVWGGGIYEDDYFYDLCDSLGIYVWQEFMFAGAMYPADDPFLENIEQEAIDNIKRLHHHSCIIVWCGNNEIDEAWHNWGWLGQLRNPTVDSIKLWNDYKKIFHELLPRLVKEYDGRPYITTSPLIGYGNKESLIKGDSHYWGVWVLHEPIETYKEKIPRFMSEYGMQAMPDWKTIEQFSLPQDWDTASSTMRTHQKHATGYQNLAIYLQQNNLHSKTFKEFVSATQEVQSRSLEIAIAAHLNAQPRCMGTLFWQFNDCWPVASWSVIDYYGRKKKAYFTVKKLYTKKIAVIN